MATDFFIFYLSKRERKRASDGKRSKLRLDYGIEWAELRKRAFEAQPIPSAVIAATTK